MLDHVTPPVEEPGEEMSEDRRHGDDDRRTLGSALDNQMPWQIKAVGVVGVPSAIALFLVWNMVSAQSRDGGTLTTTVNNHAQAAAVHAVESKEQGLRLERYLQLICVNTAKTDLDRTNCFGR